MYEETINLQPDEGETTIMLGEQPILIGGGTNDVKYVTPTSFNISMNPFNISMTLSADDCADIVNKKYSFVVIEVEDQIGINFTCVKQAYSELVCGFFCQMDTGSDVYYWSWACTSHAIYDNVVKKIDNEVGYNAIWTIFEETATQADMDDLIAAIENGIRIYAYDDDYNVEAVSAFVDYGNPTEIHVSFADLSSEPHYPDPDSVYFSLMEAVINYSTGEISSDFVTFDSYDFALKHDLSAVATSGSYNDLTDKPDLSVFATNTALGNETTARENGDIALQNQIDAISASSDVVDIVGTHADLVDYDTSHIKANDIIKVIQDETHNNAMSYYRWVISGGTGSWVYVGSEGPFYTKSESDTLLNAKQDTIDNSHKLASDLVDDTNQTNLFVTSSEKSTWNAKSDFSGDYNDLTNKPTIPTATSDLLNDSNFVSSAYATDIWVGTQAEYDLLTPDANTIYCIKES